LATTRGVAMTQAPARQSSWRLSIVVTDPMSTAHDPCSLRLLQLTAGECARCREGDRKAPRLRQRRPRQQMSPQQCSHAFQMTAQQPLRLRSQRHDLPEQLLQRHRSRQAGPARRRGCLPLQGFGFCLFVVFAEVVLKPCKCQVLIQCSLRRPSLPPWRRDLPEHLLQLPWAGPQRRPCVARRHLLPQPVVPLQYDLLQAAFPKVQGLRLHLLSMRIMLERREHARPGALHCCNTTCCDQTACLQYLCRPVNEMWQAYSVQTAERRQQLSCPAIEHSSNVSTSSNVRCALPLQNDSWICNLGTTTRTCARPPHTAAAPPPDACAHGRASLPASCRAGCRLIPFLSSLGFSPSMPHLRQTSSHSGGVAERCFRTRSRITASFLSGCATHAANSARRSCAW